MTFLLGRGSLDNSMGEVAVERDCPTLKAHFAELVRDHGRRDVEMLREKSADSDQIAPNCP
jgi:hypothetical protein